MSGRRATTVRAALAPAGTNLAGFPTAGAAVASTQAPTFFRANYSQLGSNHVAADFNGDGRPDLAGIGAQSAAVLLNNGAGGLG